MAARKPRTLDPEDVFISPEEMQQRLDEQRVALESQHRQLAILGDHDDGDDEDAATALNNVLAELGAVDAVGSRGYVSVFKEHITGNVKSEKYIGKFEVSDYAQGNLLDTLQASYAGGRYHIRVYAPGGRGFVIKANKFIDIADSINAPQKVPETVGAQPDLSQMMNMMQQSMMEGLKHIAASMAPRESAKTTMDTLKELQMMREIFATPQTAPQPVSQVMDAMKMGMEMAMMNSGGDGNNAWAMKAMDLFGKPIMEAVMSGQIIHANTPRTAPANNAGTQPALPKPQPVEDEPMNLMIKGYLRTLAKAAAANENVEEYADSILSLLPASNLVEFEKILRADDWQQQFAAYSPDVSVHPAWYGSLRNTIIAFIDEDRAALTEGGAGDSVHSHENDTSGTSAQTDNPGGNT